ncbi:hypothetical protein JF66_00670 [Cryobacterium sp. MLB-32]|uniref:hypothetical protein n=1 Tax=Cryobacterium sp. MLB-32 TaxID=1529318 RepID=UPI0004E727AA|nr:hypothetical protein [Cryobacterium sp. MLB-32]KFF61016.1 hypothetical protein JF66_00670 [Cryobacterium sp. MLB-32]
MAGSNFLDRFRPVGAPGPGAPVGVPAADIPGVEVELAQVFAALAADADACRRIVEAARRDADRTVSQSRERAAGIIAQARLDVSAEQAAAAVRVLGDAAERDAQIMDEASRRSADLQRAGRSRLPRVVETIIDRLVAERLAGA